MPKYSNTCFAYNFWILALALEEFVRIFHLVTFCSPLLVMASVAGSGGSVHSKYVHMNVPPLPN